MVTSPALSTEPPWFGDLSALEAPRDHVAISAYRRAQPEHARADMRSATHQALTATLTYGALILAVMAIPVGLPLMVAIVVITFPDGSGIISGSISFAVTAVVLAVFIRTYGRWQFRSISREWALRGSWARRRRLAAFAKDNGLLYQARPVGLPTVGSILRVIGARYHDAFTRGIKGRSALFVNAVSDSALVQAASHWGVISIALDREVPPLLLVPKGRATSFITKIGAIGNRKRMRLEGDFDRHFTLYAPAGAEREALYVITPDLMAILIDHLPGSYVETVDATLVITAPRPLHFERPGTWADIASILDIVAPKARRQTRYLAPARSPLSGHPLRSGPVWREPYSWVAGFVVGAIVLLQVIARAIVESR